MKSENKKIIINNLSVLCFDCENWDPSEEEWNDCLSKLEKDERERILRFKFKKDQKLSLAGKILLLKLIEDELALNATEVQLGRTDPGKKPFLVFLFLNFFFFFLIFIF